MPRKKKIDVNDKAIVPVTPAELIAAESEPDGLKEEFVYPGDTGDFIVYSVGGGPLVRTNYFSLAVAKNPAGQVGLAMISTSVEHNQEVDRQVRVANTLQAIARQVDDEAEKSPGKKPPYYGALFPMALETFQPEDGRLGVFLGYHPIITTYKQLVPMSIALANQRVDLKSAAWMLGKLMKLLGYLHDMGFTLGFLDPSNVFLETAQHGVFTFDLTDVNEYPENNQEKLREVAEAAKVIWWAAGGSESEAPPHDPAIMNADQHTEFVAFLKRLHEREFSAAEAHLFVYGDEETPGLFDRIWPKQPSERTGKPKRDWHEWVTYPRVSVES